MHLPHRKPALIWSDHLRRGGAGQIVEKKLSTARDILRFEGSDRAAYWRRFSMLLTLSVVISTMGLLRDSAAVVIAAMLIAPLMTPILGIASAMVMGWLRRAAILTGIVCLAALASIGMAWALVLVSDVPEAITLPQQVTARTDPGTEDLIIALAAGVAGAYVQINKQEISLLPGAAIGVSLVPPLAAAGVLLFYGEPSAAYEAGLLFATNLGAIVLSACAVYIVYALRSILFGKGKRKLQFTASVLVALVFLTAIVVQLGTATYNRYLETRQEAEVVQALRDWADPVSIEVIRIDVKPKRRIVELWIIVDLPSETQFRIAAPADLLPEEVREVPISDMLRRVLGPNYRVVLRYQTRFAASVHLGTEFVTDAPAVEDVTEE